jgi:hypothetical protein
MSNTTNQNIMDNIEMQVLSANYTMDEVLDELGMTYEDAYSEKLTTDCLIDLLIQKRFDESPQL